MESIDSFWSAVRLLPMVEAQALIRARDKEIVEACKDRVHAAVPWNEYPAVDYVLDRILSDLG